jgi:uncharacterized protein
MKILMTGSSGLVGTALTESLCGAGHTVCRLLRPRSEPQAAGPRASVAVRWDPKTGELEGSAAGADAVVNLAGTSIASGRWTAQRKRDLYKSRVDTTRALVKAIGQLDPRPRVLVSASAVGYYGNSGDEELTEESAAGEDFLSGLARDWEQEALRAESLGIRVVCLRFGVVLAKEGGALPRMLPPFRLGAGGRLGSGKQWMSWLTLAEAVLIAQFALENESLRGSVNAVSPNPVTNREFTAVLAQALHRPTILPAPAFALRFVLGEMADALLLVSQRAVPKRLSSCGYRFVHPNLLGALAAVLGK